MAEIEDLKIVGGSTYTVGNQDIIANEWGAGKTYVKGKSYVIREHRLYVCNVTHTSVEPFDATKWTEITVGEAVADNTTRIGELSALMTTQKDSLVDAVNEIMGGIGNNGFTTFTNGAYKRMTNGCVMLYLNGATHQQDLPIPLPDKSYYFTGLNQSNAVCGFFINTSGKLSIINSSTNTSVYGTVIYST